MTVIFTNHDTPALIRVADFNGLGLTLDDTIERRKWDVTRKDIRGPATSNTCARCTTTLNSYSDAFRLFASKQITPPFDSTRFNFSLKRPKRVVRCADLTMLKFRKLNCDLLSFHFLAHEKLSSFKYRNNEEGEIARLTCIESIPRIESKIRKWRFFGKLPPQATGFLRVHASKKREERVASKVKKGRGRKRRSGGTKRGRGLRYREGGRRVPRIRDIVRQRFEPVGTRGQRCLQCRGKGEPSVFPQVDDHEERLPWLMKQHHEGNWLLTSKRTRSKRNRFVYDYESKFGRLEKKNFAKKNSTFFSYIYPYRL